MFLLGKHFRGYLKNYSTKQIKSLHAGLVFFFFFKEWKTVWGNYTEKTNVYV